MIPTPFATFSPLTMQSVDVEPLAEAREQRLDRVAAGPPDDVADEEDPHRLTGSEPGDG